MPPGKSCAPRNVQVLPMFLVVSPLQHYIHLIAQAPLQNIAKNTRRRRRETPPSYMLALTRLDPHMVHEDLETPSSRKNGTGGVALVAAELIMERTSVLSQCTQTVTVCIARRSIGCWSMSGKVGRIARSEISSSPVLHADSLTVSTKSAPSKTFREAVGITWTILKPSNWSGESLAALLKSASAVPNLRTRPSHFASVMRYRGHGRCSMRDGAFGNRLRCTTR